MKKMLSKVLALTLCVALGLSLTGGAFAAEPQTGTFDIVTGTYDYGQIVDTIIIKLDQPVGEVTPEEVAAAFSVSVSGIREQTLYGVNEMELHPRTVETAEVSEDGLTITLKLSCLYTVDGTYSTAKYAVPSTDETKYLSNGYSVTLTAPLGDLTTDLALTFSGSVTDPIVDKWGAVAETDTTYKYRWYDPSVDGYTDDEGDGFPLIIWLHGQGEFGSDNLAHITANRVTAWGEPETQDLFGGAYVLAPQGPGEAALDPVNGGWIPDKVMATINAFIDEVDNVDMNRIYIGGCSMGGIGTWRTVLANPDFFAAAFPVCGANFDGWDAESALSVIDLPIYLIHSIDDTTVNISGSTAAYDAITAAGGDNIHLALFDHVKLGDVDSATGFYAYFLGHFSWVYAHNDIDGTEEFWAEELTVGETVYTTTKPADLGYDSFKAWLAAQVRPEAGVYYTRGREVVAFGEVVTSVTVHNLPYKKATVSVEDYLKENPIVVTVGEDTVREPIGYEVGENGTSVTVKFDTGIFIVDPANGTGAKYTVTVGGEEVAYGGDTGDLDKFGSFTATTPEYTWNYGGVNKTTMDARYFVPDKDAYPAPEAGYPLVIWLHGSGERGSDNRIQVACADLPAWTETETQDIFGGAYVLAPQNHAGAGNGAPAATKSLIDQFIAEMGDIDLNRVYIGGCSYGGSSTWTMLKTYPTFFAAGFPVCLGTSFDTGEAEALAAAGTPIYMVTATGDSSGIVSGLINAYNALVAAGHDDVHFAMFEHSWFDGYDGTLEVLKTGVIEGLDGSPFLDHWSWVYVHADFDGLGEDYDGQYWIDTKVDGEYNGGAITIKDGILTYTYTSGTDEEGNPLTTSVSLNGASERPGEIGDGYATFKTWLAAQSKPQNYISIEKDVQDWGEIVSDVTVTLAEPIGELTVEDVKVEVTMSVFDWATFTASVQTIERTVTDVVVSEDGLTVELVVDNSYEAPGASATFMTYKVTLGEVVVDKVLSAVSPDVDKFESLTFTVPEYSWGTTMEARAFTPDKEAYPAPESGYPLIVWLHGGGEIGTDNRIQVAANNVPLWTEKETQDIFGGAYVFAPQNHAGGGTGAGATATMNAILQFVEMKGDIDITKVYVGGCSYGGMSTWGMLRQYPNFFAAAFPICGITEFTETELAALAAAGTPIYIIHSVDDPVVTPTGAYNAYNALKAAGKENVYLALFEHVTYVEGTPEEALAFLGHSSWAYAHKDFDASEEWWLDEYTYVAEDGTETLYETSTPAELGATSFKAWLAAQVNAAPSVFIDVTGTNPNYAAIMAIYNAGVTNGTGINTFEPDAPLTRAEFVTFLTRALDVTVDNSLDTGFTDVAVNSWETGSIAWGVATGLLEGYGDGTFGPEDAVTQTQVNLIIGRLLESLGLPVVEVIPGAQDVPATRGLAASILAQALTMLG